MVASDTPVRKQFNIKTPWYYGWNIVAATMLIQGVTLGLMTYSFTLWIAPFRQEFGAAHGTILLGASLSNAGMGLFAPVAGRILDTYSIRLLTIGGVLIFGLGYLLISVSTEIWHIIVLYTTLLPIGAIFAGPIAAQVMTARWFEKNRGIALGISSVGTSLGGVILPPVVAALNASMGWRLTHVAITVGFVILLVPILWIFVRDRNQKDVEPGNKPDNLAEGHKDSLPNASEAPVAFPQWKSTQVLRSKTYWVLAAFLGPMMAIFTSINFNLAPIVQEAGVDQQHASFMISVAAISMVVGKLVFGAMADRYEHRYIIWLTAGSSLLSLLFLQFASSYALLMLAFAFVGLMGGGMMPLLGVILGSRFGVNNFGRVNGMLAPLTMIFAFSPVAIGYMRTAFDSYDPIFQLLMIATIPTIIGGFFLGPAVPEVPRGGNNSVTESAVRPSAGST